MKRKRLHTGLFLSAIFLGLLFVLVVNKVSVQTPASSSDAPQQTSRPAGQSQNTASSSQKESSQSVSNTGARPVAYQDKSAPPHKARTVTVNNKEYPVRTYRTLMAPNDPSANQWWITNTRLSQAWDIPLGGTGTILAIIDSGFALNHEEFANRWYVGPGENGSTATEGPSLLNCTARSLPLSASCNLIDDDNDTVVDNEAGVATYENPSRLNCTAQGLPLDKSCNRLDDDANGYIDDNKGWDFINYDNLPQAGELNPNGPGTTHGTRVAGIAAATGNNNKGIAGVDWGTKILPIQALDDDDYGDTLSVGRGIYYAIEQGADVISLSLGSQLPDDFVREAVREALAAGIIVVAAAGNDGCECIVYPANYPEVLAVGAINSSDQPASFSSYGQNLDILAPGTNMTSTNWQSTNGTSAYVSGINGTSFAAPFVGGLLTRLKSQQPSATPLQLIAALTENVNRLSLPATTPLDPRYGFGAADAYKVTNRMATPRTGPFTYAFKPVSLGSVLNPSVPFEPAGQAYIYACDQNVVGATAVYELNQGGDRFFSASKVENYHATAAGYASTQIGHGCVRQPHDAYQEVREINVFRELRDLGPKQQ